MLRGAQDWVAAAMAEDSSILRIADEQAVINSCRARYARMSNSPGLRGGSIRSATPKSCSSIAELRLAAPPREIVAFEASLRPSCSIESSRNRKEDESASRDLRFADDRRRPRSPVEVRCRVPARAARRRNPSVRTLCSAKNAPATSR